MRLRLFQRLSLKGILRDYLNTFYNYAHLAQTGNRKPLKSDYITFIVLPLLVALIIVICGTRIQVEYFDILVSALSIFVGLLFSLLVLIFELAKKERDTVKDRKKQKQEEIEKLSRENEYSPIVSDLRTEIENLDKKVLFLKEIFTQVSFAIIISLISICALFLTQASMPNLEEFLSRYLSNEVILYIKYWWDFVITISAIYFLIQFLLSLVLALKRFYSLFSIEFKE